MSAGSLLLKCFTTSYSDRPLAEDGVQGWNFWLRAQPHTSLSYPCPKQPDDSYSRPASSQSALRQADFFQAPLGPRQYRSAESTVMSVYKRAFLHSNCWRPETMAARSFPNPTVASATLRERKSKIQNSMTFEKPKIHTTGHFPRDV